MDHNDSAIQTITSPSLPVEAVLTPPTSLLPHAAMLQNQWKSPAEEYHDYNNSDLNADQSTSLGMAIPGGVPLTMGHPFTNFNGGVGGTLYGLDYEEYELQRDGTSTKRKPTNAGELPLNAVRAAAAFLAVAVTKRQKIKDKVRRASTKSVASQGANGALVAAGHHPLLTNAELFAATQSEAGPIPPLLGLPPRLDFNYSGSPYDTTLPAFLDTPAKSNSPTVSHSPVASGSNGVYSPTQLPLVDYAYPVPDLAPQAQTGPIPTSRPPPAISPSSSPLSSISSPRGSPVNSNNAPLDELFQFRESMFSLVPGTWVCGFCDRSVDPLADIFTYRPAREQNHGFSAVGNEDVGTHLKNCDAVGEDRTRLMKEWRVGVKARKVQQSSYVVGVNGGEAEMADETRRGAVTGKVGGAIQTTVLEEKPAEPEPIKPPKKMAKGWKAAALAGNEPVVKKPGRPQSKAIAKREAAAKLLEQEMENHVGEGGGTSAGAARLAAKRKAAAANAVVKKVIIAGRLKATKKPKSLSSSSDAGLSTPNFDGT